MDRHMLKSEIDVLTGQIKQETDQYFEAITRKKDFMIARNIKLRLNSLHKNLDSRMQLLGNYVSMK
jgi:hypothetical protein